MFQGLKPLAIVTTTISEQSSEAFLMKNNLFRKMYFTSKIPSVTLSKLWSLNETLIGFWHQSSG